MKRLCFALALACGCHDWEGAAKDCTVENGCLNPNGAGGGNGGPTVPTPPTGVTATGGTRMAHVKWSAPASNGGSELLDYTVTPSGGTSIPAPATATEIDVPNLADGTRYTFTVVANNMVGPSAASSPSNEITTAAVPGAPMSVSATAGNMQATVQWAAPAQLGDGTFTGYTVTSNPGGFTEVAAPTETQATVTGLSNGESYTFTVRASNTIGQGPASQASNAVTPATVPGAPTGISALAGNMEVEVHWMAPAATGGSPITGYTVTSSPGGFTVMGGASATQVTVTGLVNGVAYAFTVKATNAIGPGPDSAPSAPVTPNAVPGPPTAVSATAGNMRATVQWAAPTNTGGSPLTGFEVTSIPGGLTATAGPTATQVDVTGLTNGTPYTFTVVARNATGPSLPSAMSNTVIPVTFPGAPTGVSAIGGNSAATVQWTAPVDTGGSSIIHYTVVANPGGFMATTPDGMTTQATVMGLVNGTAYTFTVRATNGLGDGPTSAVSNPVTPRDVPGQPTNVVATPGNTQATVTWIAPVNSGGSPITSYTVTSTPGGFSLTVGPSPTQAIMMGLTNGVPYTFKVKATNAAGDGLDSLASGAVTPATVPGAPTAVIATAGDTQATVQWTAPSNTGGLAITTYTVRATPGSITVMGSSSPVIVSGLTNGVAYTFTVTATNGVGEGLASSPSNAVTPATVPGQPTSVVATAGVQQATVQWVPPASTGGSPILSYTATSSPGAQTATVTAGMSQAVVGGLTGGVLYTFTVHATNAIGNSMESSASPAVTPTAVPGAPLGVTAFAGDTLATVMWNLAAPNGSPVTGYTVYLPDGGTGATTTGTSAMVTSLSNGASYTFTVTATNAIGTGPASLPSTPVVIPYTVPDAPTGVTAMFGNMQATVQWTAPFDQGRPITGYTVLLADAGVAATTTGATTTVAGGLTNGTPYTFRVRATNFAGNSALSTASAPVVPCTVPSAPRAVTALGLNAKASVEWVAPAATNGCAVSGYTVTSVPGGFTATVGGTARTATVSGLTNGVAYTFNVAASNLAGAGAAGTSNAVTPEVPCMMTLAFTAADAGSGALSPGWVTAADFNLDGNLDFAELHGGSTGALPMMGDGTGAFSALPPAAPLSAAFSQAARGDFNGDGRPDLVVVYTGISNPTTVYFITSAANGALSVATIRTIAQDFLSGLAVADVNNDSRADVLVGDAAGFRVMLGNGNGSFSADTAGSLGEGYLEVADFNGDGNVDVVGTYLNGVNLALGNGMGGFTGNGQIVSLTSPRGIAVADFNGDGRADVAAGGGTTLSVLLGNGNGTFLPRLDVTLAATMSRNLIAADMNGDGALDLLLGEQTNHLAILRGNGMGGFGSEQRYPVPSTPGGLAVGDFNRDGKLDVLVPNQSADRVTRFQRSSCVP